MKKTKWCFLGIILLAVWGCGKQEEKDSSTRVAADIKSGNMILIPAGEFWMGSLAGEGGSDEHPRHRVSLGAFYIDKHEVRTEDYRACLTAGKCPDPVNTSAPTCNLGMFGVFDKKGYPMNCLQWDEAKAYCEWAGKRLPTEAEWEKAARGGTETRWSFGDNEGELGNFAWYRSATSEGQETRPVGLKKPNQYGMYDMYGNVAEWVADKYSENYYTSSPINDPRGPDSERNESFVLRGGAWIDDAEGTRSAARASCLLANPDNNYHYGFRCAI
jgi:formylglycine-generating enzyme required for sulfatase activity